MNGQKLKTQQLHRPISAAQTLAHEAKAKDVSSHVNDLSGVLMEYLRPQQDNRRFLAELSGDANGHGGEKNSQDKVVCFFFIFLSFLCVLDFFSLFFLLSLLLALHRHDMLDCFKNKHLFKVFILRQAKYEYS